MPDKKNIFKKSYGYPNLTALFIVIAVTYFLGRTGILDDSAHYIGRLGYLGIFIIGMFFVSTFTVTPATALFFLMLDEFSILQISLIGGIGSVLGDYILFRFMKDGLVGELRQVFRKVGGDSIFKIRWVTYTKYFTWLGPVLGALIIASPFPDELGIGLLGVYQLSDRKFMMLSWVLDTIGIFLLLSAVSAVS